MESIQQTFNGTADFGKRVSCTISRNGDLIHRVYLQVDIPAVSISGASFRWIDALGHFLINTVELQIGGQRIDLHYGDWLEIFNELTIPAGLKAGYQRMIGNTYSLTTTETDPSGADDPSTIEKPQTTLYIPLQFFFCRNPGLALPLIALQYHEVVINIEFNRAANCYIVGSEGQDPVPSMINPNLQNASLYVDYIYLDTDERRRFAQVSHEYLIEQLQFTGEETFTGSSYKSRLNFNHPVKELVWVVQRSDVVDNGVNQWSNYTTQRALNGDVVEYNDTGINEWSNNQFPSTTSTVPGLTDAGVLGGRESGRPNQYASGSANYYGSLGPNGGNASGAWNGTINAGDLTPNVPTATGLTYPHVFGGPGAQNCVWAAKLLLNGHDRFSERKGDYFNLVQPYQHHTNIPDSCGINVYSFALKPEDHQPTGTCNMSRIDNATLMLSVHPDIASSQLTKKLRVYAVNYNVLRIMSGMGGLLGLFIMLGMGILRSSIEQKSITPVVFGNYYWITRLDPQTFYNNIIGCVSDTSSEKKTSLQHCKTVRETPKAITTKVECESFYWPRKRLGYSKNVIDEAFLSRNGQSAATLLRNTMYSMKKVQRLNGSGCSFIDINKECLRYSLLPVAYFKIINDKYTERWGIKEPTATKHNTNYKTKTFSTKLFIFKIIY
jgi:hypothetical protein